jgi:hypothetical protein
MSETHISIRLLRMYFPRNWEFGSALPKLRNFGVGGLGTPLEVRQLPYAYCLTKYVFQFLLAMKSNVVARLGCQNVPCKTERGLENSELKDLLSSFALPTVLTGCFKDSQQQAQFDRVYLNATTSYTFLTFVNPKR